MMYRQINKYNYIYTYSFFILCIEFHVSRMQTRFPPQVDRITNKINRACYVAFHNTNPFPKLRFQ